MQIHRDAFRLGTVSLIIATSNLGCSNFVFGLESYIEDDYDNQEAFGLSEEEMQTDEAEESEESDEEFIDEALCEDAADHLESCGIDYFLPEICDSQAAAEAEVMLELTCDEMDTAMTAEGPLPLCTWFGWN